MQFKSFDQPVWCVRHTGHKVFFFYFKLIERQSAGHQLRAGNAADALHPSFGFIGGETFHGLSTNDDNGMAGLQFTGCAVLQLFQCFDGLVDVFCLPQQK